MPPTERCSRPAPRVARSIWTCPERQVVLDRHGKVTSVTPRPRLDSHRLIEEFMILANVAAAEELERLHQSCMYRVHAPPSEEKLQALRDFLHTLGITLPPGNAVHPRDLDRVLRRVAGTPEARLVNEVMLRSQSQAAYSPDNIGHFGLALPRYAHFTSPIRRYADLLVHRALITGLRLGAGGLEPEEAAGFAQTAEHITATERRAQLAERDAIDRYLAAYMADKTGAHFAGRISGVTRFALFVTVTESGASGIVPIATLPDDYWQHDAREQTLTGRRTRHGVPTGAGGGGAPGGSQPCHRRPGVPYRPGHATARETVPPQVNRLAVLLIVLLIVPVHAQPAANAGFDSATGGECLFRGARLHGATHPGPGAGADAHRLGAARPDRARSEPARDGAADGKLVLTEGQLLVAAEPVPANIAPAAWAAAAVQLSEAAAIVSPAVREAGTQGIIQSFFDELFNHLDPYSRYVAAARGGGGSGRSQSAPPGWASFWRSTAPNVLVQAAMSDGPAAMAGVRPGDVVLSVDGMSMRGHGRCRGRRLARGTRGHDAAHELARPTASRARPSWNAQWCRRRRCSRSGLATCC